MDGTMIDLDKERRHTSFLAFRSQIRQMLQDILRGDAGKKSSLHLCKMLYFFFFGIQAAYMPFIPVMISSVGASQAEIGVISAVRPFIGFISMPAIGLAADKLGRHKLILMILIAVSAIMRLGLLGCTSLIAVALIVVLSDFFSNPVGSIIDSTVLDALPDPLQYGKQRLWGTIGWGSCAPLAGLIISKFGNSAALWVHGLGSVIVLFLVSLFRVHTPPTKGTMWSVWRVIFKDARTFCFFIGTIIMGQAYGAIGAFLFVRLAEIGGSALLMGMTLFVNCLVEAPVFHVSEPIIRRLGLIGVLQLCLLLMSVRLAFYGLMESPWWVLCVEGIHGVTFALLWTAGTTHWRRIGPEGMGATMQGFYTGIKYGIGSGSGSLIAGGLAHAYGLSRMFLYMAAATAAVVCRLMGVGVLLRGGNLKPESASAIVLLLRLAGLLDDAPDAARTGVSPAGGGHGPPGATAYVNLEDDLDPDAGQGPARNYSPAAAVAGAAGAALGAAAAVDGGRLLGEAESGLLERAAAGRVLARGGEPGSY